MKNLIAILLLILLVASASSAIADPRIDNMVVRCESAMNQGLCRVALDPRDYRNETIPFAGIGRVKTASYLKLRNFVDARNADGTYKMCVFVREACTNDWASADCFAARANWRQTAP